jgi:hypothetical protein
VTLLAPANLHTTAIASTTVGLAWNAVSGAVGYEIVLLTSTVATLTLTPSNSQIVAAWSLSVGADGANGAILSRDGTDRSGTGAWAASNVVGTNGTITFTSLFNDTAYHITCQPTINGVVVPGTATTVSAIPTATSTTNTTVNLTLTPGNTTILAEWSLNVGQDAATGAILSRDGVDSQGGGAWSAPNVVAVSGTLTFTNLNNGSSYNITAQPTKVGASIGTANTKAATPSTVPTPASTTDAGFVYTGTWATVTGEHTSTASGATAVVTFTAAAANVTASLKSRTSSANGIVGVKIDNGTETMVDLYSATNVPNSIVFTSAALAAGQHTMTVRSTATKNTSSSAVTASVMGATLTNGFFASVGGTGKWASITLPSRGWFSGGAGEGIDGLSTGFGDWRGSACDAISHWIDGPDGSGWGGGINSPAAGFPGIANIAIGGASDWGAAAGGSMDGQLATLLQLMRSQRIIGGVLRPTVIRPAHEMNGNWYAWSVWPGGESNFKAAMQRWHGILMANFPECLWEICFNGESTTGVSVSNLYDPAGGWDIVGVDRYNNYPWIGPGGVTWDDGSTRGTLTDPIGITKWSSWAAARGLPLSIPEYANNPDFGDATYWWDNFGPWLAANHGSAPGKVVMDSWFNEGPQWAIYGSAAGRNNATASSYRPFFQAH